MKMDLNKLSTSTSTYKLPSKSSVEPLQPHISPSNEKEVLDDGEPSTTSVMGSNEPIPTEEYIQGSDLSNVYKRDKEILDAKNDLIDSLLETIMSSNHIKALHDYIDLLKAISNCEDIVDEVIINVEVKRK